ncbi:DsrE family protein [Magnetococcales bacterium HHB-1]
MSKIIGLFLFFALLSGISPIVLAETDPAQQKSTSATSEKRQVILQISENSIDKVAFSLNAALFLSKKYGTKHIDLLIVAYGDGILPFRWETPIPIRERIQKAYQSGIRIAISETSMRKRDLLPSDMRPEIDYLEFAEGEILEKQYLGWAYLRL